ncbi:MAG: cyclic nucleotide-binding domain-containing protein [Anaerolineae bacterium]
MLSIRTEERFPFALLFVELFFLAIGVILIQTAAFALFLSTFGGGAIPYSDIAIAFIAAAISLVNLQLGSRVSLPRLATIDVAFMMVGTLLLWAGLTTASPGWLIFILPSWFQSSINLTFFVIYTLAGRVFDVRQAKRLFGLLGAGYLVAYPLIGFAVPFIVSRIGTANLLIVATVALAAGLGLQFYILRRYHPRFQPVSVGHKPVEEAPSPPLLQNRYVMLIVALIVLSWVGFFVIDNIFYSLAALRYPNADDLAAFLGIFASIIGIVSLIFSIFLTAPILGRYGVRGGLITMPASLTAGAVGIIVTSVISALSGLVFLLAVFTKLLSVVYVGSIELASVVILYQPLPPRLRLRAQSLGDTIFQPIGIGLAGVVLIIFTSVLAFSPTQLAWVFLAVAAIWLPIVFLVARAYKRVLAEALRQRKLQASPLDLNDASSIATLRAGIQNPNPDAALFSLNMLQAADPNALTEALPGLLDHPSPEMRAEALDRIARLGLTNTAARVRECATTDPSPSVRGHAVRALASLRGAAAVLPMLDDLTPEVQQGAIVGLLTSGRPHDTDVATTWLDGAAHSSDPTQRILAARVIAESPAHERQLLSGLLSDTQPEVRLAALHAARAGDAPATWPCVIAALAEPATRGAARQALTRAGDDAMPAIAAAFENRETPQSTRIELARVCERVRSPSALAILEAQIQTPDAALRDHVLRALAAGGYTAPEPMVGPIHHQIDSELALAAWAMAARDDVGYDEATDLLQEALQVSERHIRDRLFWLLSFIEDRQTILRARDAYHSPDAAQRAYALEVLETRMPRDLKDIMAVLDYSHPGRSLKHLAPRYPQAKQTREQRLTEIIDGSADGASPWLRACAMNSAVQLGAVSCADAVAAAQAAPDPIVTETAAWALGRLRGDPQEGSGMRSTLEKVIILKSTSLFAGTPDEVLAAVARQMRDVSAAAGETIIHKGEPGDSMYIIVQGMVRIHDGDHVLTHLGQGEVVGEMALLDPEPRAASVTAEEESDLLRLDQEPFSELIEDRIEVTRAIMRILTRRVRALDREAVQLQAQLASKS